MKINSQSNINIHNPRLVNGLSFFMIGLALLTPPIVYFSAKNPMMKLTTLKQTITSTKVSDLQINQTQNFVANNQESIESIISVFPAESDFLDFLITLETMLAVIDPGAKLTPGSSPVKAGQQLTVPLQLQFTGTIYTLEDFFIQLERLPYIIEVTSLELKSPSGLAQPSEIVASLRVYVEDPFRK